MMCSLFECHHYVLCKFIQFAATLFYFQQLYFICSNVFLICSNFLICSMSLVGHRTIHLFSCYIFMIECHLFYKNRNKVKDTYVQYTQTDTIRQFRWSIGTNGTIDTNRTDDVIPMPIGAKWVLDQVIARYNYYLYSSFYKPTTNGVYPWYQRSLLVSIGQPRRRSALFTGLAAVNHNDQHCWSTLIINMIFQYKNLVLSNELIKVKLPPLKIWKADVSSVSPSSERIEELWVVVVYMRV